MSELEHFIYRFWDKQKLHWTIYDWIKKNKDIHYNNGKNSPIHL